MPNREIKKAASAAKVKLWQIADELGIADCTFSRKLRYELSAGEKQKIYEIIKKLSEGVKE